MLCFPHFHQSTNSYVKYSSVDDVISMPDADEIVKHGNFFRDKTTISYALEQAKVNESFNAVMIETAYFVVNGNNSYTKNPVFNQIDEVNIIARKASKLLQDEIDKGNCHYVTAGSILDQLIVAEVKGVSVMDINNSDWVANNPLTKAMISCIGTHHDQPNINAVISDSVIQYYQYKMEEHASLDLDNYVKGLTDALLLTVFASNVETSTATDRAGFYRELREMGNTPSDARRNAVHIQNYL
ncbi:hypothetical protein [Yersinia frederiksenii]|uniref:hypothetical protein n=1 Tax=Yersinia frederiksenii TaxID=29484 RepID=UPI0005DC2561|nr:hypothetical protein [Yersinia frederiksenii]CQH59426.1 Uncharacterised protein [Yersinia frederiksenii]